MRVTGHLARGAQVEAMAGQGRRNCLALGAVTVVHGIVHGLSAELCQDTPGNAAGLATVVQAARNLVADYLLNLRLMLRGILHAFGDILIFRFFRINFYIDGDFARCLK